MKLNIHKRVLLLVLSAGILSFFVVTLISSFGMTEVRQNVLDMGKNLGESGANYTQTLMTSQLKQTLGELAESRAKFIDHELEFMKENVIILGILHNFSHCIRQNYYIFFHKFQFVVNKFCAGFCQFA